MSHEPTTNQQVEPDHAETSNASTTDGSRWQSHLKFFVLSLFIAIVAVAASATVLVAIDVFCLIFLAIVFAVFVRKCGVWIGQKTSLGTQGGIAIVVILLIGSILGSIAVTGGLLAEKVREAQDEFENAINETRQVLNEYPVVDSVVRGVPGLKEILARTDDEGGNDFEPNEVSRQSNQSDGDQAGRSTDTQSTRQSRELPVGALISSGVGKQAASVGGRAILGLLKIFATTFGVLTSAAVIFFVGLFLAVDPPLYRDSLALLAPKDRRDAFVSLCNNIGETLWSWLLGRFGTMLITGVGVWLVMALLGVPLPFLLGAFTALMVFIPNIGAAIAVSLAVLLALPKGIVTVAMVVVAYLVFQMIEGYVLTPIIQKRAVQLPPALLISSQIVLAVLFGFVGVLVATPLVAVGIVLVRRVYIDDVFDCFSERSHANPA